MICNQQKKLAALSSLVIVLLLTWANINVVSFGQATGAGISSENVPPSNPTPISISKLKIPQKIDFDKVYELRGKIGFTHKSYNYFFLNDGWEGIFVGGYPEMENINTGDDVIITTKITPGDLLPILRPIQILPAPEKTEFQPLETKLKEIDKQYFDCSLLKTKLKVESITIRESESLLWAREVGDSEYFSIYFKFQLPQSSINTLIGAELILAGNLGIFYSEHLKSPFPRQINPLSEDHVVVIKDGETKNLKSIFSPSSSIQQGEREKTAAENLSSGVITFVNDDYLVIEDNSTQSILFTEPTFAFKKGDQISYAHQEQQGKKVSKQITIRSSNGRPPVPARGVNELKNKDNLIPLARYNVLGRLLKNSFEYTPGKARFRLRLEGQEYSVVVRDYPENIEQMDLVTAEMVNIVGILKSDEIAPLESSDESDYPIFLINSVSDINIISRRKSFFERLGPTILITTISVMGLAFFWVRTLQGEVAKQTSRLRETLQKEESLRNEAESANRAKSQFLANMSHELRTPLNGVVGMTDLLLESSLSNKNRKFATTIKDCSKGLLKIINDILDFSKIEAGKMELYSSEFDVQDVMDEVISMTQHEINEKNLEFISNVDRAVPLQLFGDDDRLRQVLLNLISNAIKFTSQGTIRVSCQVEKIVGNDVSLRFSVSDTGIGITEDAITKLFQAFSQADSSMTRKYGGTGLGLTICKKLVHLMGGDITLKSKPGEGTRIEFSIKIKKAENTASNAKTLIYSNLFLLDNHCPNEWDPLPGLLRQNIDINKVKSVDDVVSTINHRGIDKPALLLWYRPSKREEFMASVAEIRRKRPGISIICLTKKSDLNQIEILRLDHTLYEPFQVRDLFKIDSNPLSRSASTITKGISKTAEDQDEKGERFKSNSENLKIIVAEDNPVNARLVEYYLHKLGFKPTLVENGRELVDAIKADRFDIVLTDCQMPVMDGYQATQEIRNSSEPLHQPWIIAITAHSLEGEKEKCIASGMDDYVSKPMRLNDLKQALDRSRTRTTA